MGPIAGKARGARPPSSRGVDAKTSRLMVAERHRILRLTGILWP
jgi:hypothetical protein